MQYYIDYSKSRGNFFADHQGNIILDLYCQGGSLPLGYNHDYLLDAVSSTRFDKFLLQKPVIQMYPPHDFYTYLRQVISPISPRGLPDVTLLGNSGPTAIEMAIKAAFLRYIDLHYKGSMEKVEKGLSVLTFYPSSHGSSLATIGLSKENPLNDRLPSLEVLNVPFPAAKLPLFMHIKENTQNEKKCVEDISNIISKQLADKPVAAIIVEPIQHISNVFASREFYKGLRELSKAKGIPFIVNEIHTGCGTTGKFWASDHWTLEDTADILVFGKKCQITGYFSKPEFIPKDPNQITDCWNDVGWKLVQLDVTNGDIFIGRLQSNQTMEIVE